METFEFLAGPGRVLFIDGQRIIGVGKTLTDTTFDMSITAEEIRGGAANALRGKYFHDSNMNITIVDAGFNMEYVAAALGTTIEAGGLSLYESPKAGETVVAQGKIPIPYEAVPTDGALFGWYKKPTDTDWTVGTIDNVGKTMTANSAQIGETYCVKFFYINENAKSMKIKANYVPKVLHVVIINDIFSGATAQIEGSTRYGRLITDIPAFQLDGTQNLALTAGSAATVSLTGSALALDDSSSCDEDLIYGTMTKEVFGATWKDDVVAITFADSELEMTVDDTTTVQVYVVYGNGMASQIKDNSNFTFAVETTPASTTSNVEIGASTGVITTTGATAGTCVISATLTGYDATVPPALATVTVSV